MKWNRCVGHLMRKMMWRCKTSCSTDRVNNISMTDLIKEIESNLMSSKKEQNDSVCLGGLAAVCDLTVKCACNLKVSEVYKWLLMTRGRTEPYTSNQMPTSNSGTGTIWNPSILEGFRRMSNFRILRKSRI